MTYKVKDSPRPNTKYLVRGSCEVGSFYEADDDGEWFYSSRYPDDFYSAEELREIADIIDSFN